MEEGKCLNRTTQSATCIMCKRGLVGLGMKDGVGYERFFRIVAAFWAVLQVEVIQQETGVVQCCRRAAIGTPFSCLV